MRWVLVLGWLAVLIVSCRGQEVGPEISEARVGRPTGPHAAMYFTATSDGEGDRLLGADTEMASAVEIHETTISDDGMMGMQSVAGLDLPAGGELVLEPGAYHLMLIDAQPMEVGDTIQVTITWETAGQTTVDVEVVDPAATTGHDD